MRAALHAEWTKMRTVAGPRWLLLGLIVATVALGAAVASVVSSPAAGVRVTVIGVELGQAPAAVLAVLLVSGEYSSGLIRTTLTATPHRAAVLAAKAVALAGAVAVAGTVAVLGSLLAGRLILGRRSVTLSPGPVVYLILIALLSLGIAAVVRDSAASIGVVLGLLYLIPILARVTGSRLLQHLGPTTAGLGVTAGWAAAALLAGGLSMRVRDA